MCIPGARGPPLGVWTVRVSYPQPLLPEIFHRVVLEDLSGGLPWSSVRPFKLGPVGWGWGLLFSLALVLSLIFSALRAVLSSPRSVPRFMHSFGILAAPTSILILIGVRQRASYDPPPFTRQVCALAGLSQKRENEEEPCRVSVYRFLIGSYYFSSEPNAPVVLFTNVRNAA